MNKATRERVRIRAGNRCEYCHLRQESAPLVSFHVEHVIPRQHGGEDNEDNLCLSCARCNFYKGPNLAGIDTDTGKLARLFDPRTQTWDDHFRWSGAELIGTSRTGRATVAVLKINHPERVELRQRLLDENDFPFD